MHRALTETIDELTAESTHNRMVTQLDRRLTARSRKHISGPCREYSRSDV